MKKFFPLIVLFLLLSLTACSKEEIDKPDEKSYYELLTEYEREIVTYFQDVALGFEFGSASKVTRKWSQPMKIFVGGEPSQELLNELQSITTEINGLATDGFHMEVVSDSLNSNFYLFLGSGHDYASIFPYAKENVENNWGLFYLFIDAADYLYRGNMYVDIYRTTSPEARKHLLREELTQSLGLAKDSELYEESIFQQKWTTVSRYSPMDRELIKLLYHPDMEVGLDALEVREVLAEILLQQ